MSPGIQPDALESLRAPLQRYAQRYLVRFEDAEDVVQDVFARALQAEAAPDELRPWLYRSTRNACLNRLRGAGARNEHELATAFDLGADQTGHLTRLIREEDGQDLAASLERLSPAQREAVYLRYIEDLPREEIAAVIGESVSVVKSRIYEGLSRLRETYR